MFYIALAFLVFFLAFVAMVLWATWENARAQTPVPGNKMPLTDCYVVDGDTIGCAGMPAHIRIVGIDTPETFNPHCTAERIAGNAATGRLHNLLRRAGTLSAIFYDKRDRNNRFLARVFAGDREVGKILVQEGYGIIYDGKSRRRHWRDTLCPGVPLNASTQSLF